MNRARPSSKRGRPTRSAASAKTLKALIDGGVDPTTIDPRTILAGIAADTSAPATARVAACRTLLTAAPTGGDEPVAGDPLSRRAIQLLRRTQ
jgi:hypothetical protein